MKRLKITVGIILACALLIAPIVTFIFVINGLVTVVGGHRAEAEVTSVVPVKTSETNTKYKTIVSFVDSRNSVTQLTLNDVETNQYEVGTRLPIIYQKGTSRVGPTVKIDDFWTIWGGAVIGAVMTVIIIVIFSLFTKYFIPKPASYRPAQKRLKKR